MALFLLWLKDFAYVSGERSVTPKDISLLQVLGQRTELSFYDIAIVNNNYCGGNDSTR